MPRTEAEPRHHTARSDRPTRGGGVAKVAQAKHAPLMPWQRRAVDVALEYEPETRVNAFGIVVVTVPRQSGKTKVEGDVADHRCLTLPRARVWVTMQNGKTVDSWMREEHFENLAQAEVFGRPNTPSARYSRSRRAGEVGIRWANGSTFLTFPPKRDALHSKQSDLVMVDEAWAHNAQVGQDIRQAVRPTMATRRGSQLWVVSTEGDDSSEYLESYVAMAMESLGVPGTRVCFIDYGIGDDVDPEDLDAVAAAHPAYGHTIDMQALVDARAEFGADVAGWARAYGNRRTRTREAAINASVWMATARPRLSPPERAGIGLDVSPAGTRVAVAAGWRAECTLHPCAGGVHGFTESLYAGPTSRDLPRLLVDLSRRAGSPIVVDRGSVGALEVVDAVAQLSPSTPVKFLTMPEYASACGTYYRGVYQGTTHHGNDPELTAAVEVATKRDLGDGAFGWGRKKSGASITELVAASIALKAWDQLPVRQSLQLVTAP